MTPPKSDRGVFTVWARKVLGQPSSPEEATQLETRRAELLDGVRRSRSAALRCPTRTNDPENFPVKGRDEADPFVAQKLLEAGPLPASGVTGAALDWNPTAPNSVLIQRDAEFAVDVVKVNTAMNLAIVQRTETDSPPGSLEKKTTRTARLAALFRRKPNRVRIGAQACRTSIFLTDDGRHVIKETSADEAVKLNFPKLQPTLTPGPPSHEQQPQH